MMLVMTGIAVAATTTTLSVTNNPITVSVGETKFQTVKLELDELDPLVSNAIIKIEIFDLPAGISASIDGTPGVVLTGPWSSSKTWTVGFTNGGAKNKVDTITYNVTYLNDKSITRQATIQAGVEAIPEFPTVALPIAVVIGMVMLFQHKKIKE